MAANDMTIDIDTREFEQALDECAAETRIDDYMELTVNAQSYLASVVRHLPERTGNLRSAAIPVWRHLRIPGRPLTNLEPGEKIASWIEHSTGRHRSARLMSKGTFDDQRKAAENPYFRYDLFAAEWRGRNKKDRSGSAIEKALRSGLLGAADIRRVARLIQSGATYTAVWGFLVDALSGSASGRSWLINTESGFWHPYSTFFKGNRKKVTPDTGAFKFTGRHAKTLEKHSGR